MPTLESLTTFEFDDRESLVEFAKRLPFQPDLIEDLIEGGEIVDDEDEVDGVPKVVHKFKIKED